MLQHPGNRISLESYDVEVGFFSYIPTKKCTWKELHQLKEHQDACPFPYLTVLSLSVWYLSKSHSSYSGQGVGAAVSHRRAQKHCLTLCCRLGCVGSPRPGLLSLSTCLFHRKCVWFLWNSMQAVSTVPSESTFVCKLTVFLRISLDSCSLYLLTQPLVQYHGNTEVQNLAMGAAIAHMKNVFL